MCSSVSIDFVANSLSRTFGNRRPKKLHDTVAAQTLPGFKRAGFHPAGVTDIQMNHTTAVPSGRRAILKYWSMGLTESCSVAEKKCLLVPGIYLYV